MDTAVLVISLVLGFALILMFIYRLGIEERFDRASVACLCAGVILIALVAVGYRRSGEARHDDLAKLESLHQQIAELDGAAGQLASQVGLAQRSANDALILAQAARERAAITKPLLGVKAELASLRTELRKSQPPKQAKGSNGTSRLEARLQAIEKEIRMLRSRT